MQCIFGKFSEAGKVNIMCGKMTCKNSDFADVDLDHQSDGMELELLSDILDSFFNVFVM
jgi:hypothetical protein